MKGGDKKMNKEIKEENNQHYNLSIINNMLRSGITREEYEGIKDLPVSSRWTVQDLVTANLRCGSIRYKEGKFTTIQSTVKIGLTSNEEAILNQKAVEAGLNPTELAEKYVTKGLSNN